MFSKRCSNQYCQNIAGTHYFFSRLTSISWSSKIYCYKKNSVTKIHSCLINAKGLMSKYKIVQENGFYSLFRCFRKFLADNEKFVENIALIKYVYICFNLSSCFQYFVLLTKHTYFSNLSARFRISLYSYNVHRTYKQSSPKIYI